MYRISVIVPSYKPKEYLWECLDSVYNQTMGKEYYELILILNGCNEPYFSSIEEWISAHAGLNIRFIQTDESGVSNARNIALSIATGDYLIFLDDDDYLSSNYLNEMYKLSSENSIIISNILAFDEDCRFKEHPNLYKKEYDRLYLNGPDHYYNYRRLFMSPWMKLVPRKYTNDRLFDIRFSNWEDTLFFYNISDRMDVIAASSPDVVYYRRCRNNSAVGSFYYRKTRVLKLTIKMLLAIIRIYIPNFRRYNFIYTIRCMLSAMHAVFVKPSNSY